MKAYETEEKRRRLSYVDWFILLLVGVLLFVGARYLQRRRKTEQPNVVLTYTVLLSGVDQDENGISVPLKEIEIGSEVYSENGTAMLGKVVSCTALEHFAMTVKDGETVAVSVPGKADVYVTVKGEGIEREGDGVRINNIRIAAGASGTLRLGRYFAQSARILTLDRRGYS